MAHLGVLFSVLCFSAILAASAFPAPSASTSENPRGDAAHRADLSKSKNAEDEPNCPWNHVGHAENAHQARGQFTKDSSRFNEDPVEETRRSRHTGGRHEDDVSRSGHQRGPAVDLSSHDILPNPGLISANQAGRSAGDHRDPASSLVRSTSSGDVKRRSIDSPRRRSPDVQDDIGVAEDRYRPQYPYSYQQQYPNQRYRANDRRDPYRNYVRYPVFPGR